MTPYTYSWDHDGTLTSDTASNLSAGDYSVTVTDAVDSTVTIQHTLTEPDPIVFNADSTHITTCYGDSTGAITLNPTGGTQPYSYFWTTSDGGGLNATAEDQTGLAAGTYTVTITDDNGCTADTTITLTQPEDMTFSAVIDHLTNADPQGSVDLTVSGATPPYNGYSWNGPNGFTASTEDISGLTEGGDYTVTATDDNSCEFDTTVNVIDSTQLDIFFHPDSITHVSCNGGSDGRVVITVIEPANPPTYTWTGDPQDPASTDDSVAYNLPAGEYFVEVNDGDTTIIDSVTIIEPDPLDLTFTSSTTDSVDCNGDADGIIDIEMTGGTTPYAYSWTTSDGSGLEPTQQDQNGLTAGTYEVTVTDANGCTINASYTIEEPAPLDVGIAINNGISCYGFTDGELEANPTGGTASYSYQWDDGASQTTRIADGLGQGTYQVTVTDANGCEAATSQSLSQPDSLQVDSYSSSDITCNGADDGEIHLSASGGTGTIWYELEPGGALNNYGDFTSLGPANYTVTVTDDNNCPGPGIPDTIVEPDALSIDVVESTDITTCNGDASGSINVDASGGTGTLSYTLQPNGITNSTGEFTGLTADTYTVEVDDVNGCGPISTGNITLTEPPAIQINDTTHTDVTCNGGTDGTIAVGASGGTGALTYTLQPDDITNGTGSFSGLDAGTYSVEVNDENGCGPLSTGNIIIDQPSAISISGTSSSNVTCNGGSDGSLSVTASGGTGTLTYTLQPDGISNNTGDFNNLTAGTYTVDITDENGCGPVTSSEIDITEPMAITITDTTYTDITCNGNNDGAISVTATGGSGELTYTLQPDGTTNSTGDFTGLTPGTYTVDVTDANGCGPVTTNNLVLEEPDALSIDNVSYSDVTCNGGTDGSITATASGGTGTLTYTLQPNDVSNTTGEFTGLTAGTYTVEVDDDNSCGPVTSSEVTIGEPAAINVTGVTSNDASCNGCGDGTITVTAEGGTGTLTYTLQPDGTTNTTGEFTGLDVGTYSVDVNDAEGCGPVNSGDIGIGEPSQVTINSTSSQDLSCNGSNDGTITVTASGGNQPLIYTLQPDGTTNNDGEFTGLDPGTYSVDVTDQGGYGPVSTADIVISEPDALNVTGAISSDVTCNGASDGSITVSAEGGTGGLTYTLLPNDLSNGTGSFTSLDPGTYTVEVTDENGCGPVSTSDIDISEPAAITISSSTPSDVTCKGGNDGSITVSATGGSGALTYTLQPDGISNGTGEFTGLDAGNYSVEVTDEQGCGPATTGDISVNEPAALGITGSSFDNVSCNGGSDGSLTISATGGSGTLTYTLQPDGTTNTTGEFTGLDAGTYSVDITDENGCGPITSSDFNITEPAAISISSTSTTDVSCYGAGDGSIVVTATGGSGTLSYTLQPDGISNGTGEFSGLDAGTYSIEVSDENGCGPVSTSDITLSEPAPVDITSAAVNDINCNGGTDGSITVAAEGGTAPLTYVLQPLGMTNSTGEFTGIQAGAYTVEVSDANGCGPADTTLEVVEPDPLTFSSVSTTHITQCADAQNGAIQVVATGATSPLTYTLNPVGTTKQDGNFTNLDPGTYTVEVTGANGCSTIDTTVELTGPDPIVIDNIELKHVLSCVGDANGSIDVQASGGTGNLTYSVSPGGYENFLGEFTGLTGGTYTIEVTDENECGPVDTTVVINEPEAIEINNVSSTNITGCYGDSTGTITVDAAGGSGSLSYTLQPNGLTNATGAFTNLTAGTYSIEVTDAHNCGPVTTSEITLTQPEPLAINNIDTTFVSSDGAADGSIIVDAAGGTTPLSYILNPDSLEVNETGQFTGLAAGDYRVVVTGQNGCQPDTSEQITIEVAPDTQTDELEVKYHLRIYPNPANKKVTLSMNMSDTHSDVRVHILNTIGQLQQVIRFEGTNREMLREVNLNDYRGGVYVLKFFDSEDYLGQRLLIISR